MANEQNQRKTELNSFQLCFSLSSYLYFLVTKKSLRLQVHFSIMLQPNLLSIFSDISADSSTNEFTLLQISDVPLDYNAAVGLQLPTLSLLGSFLTSVTTALERAAEEKSLLLNKVKLD